MQTIDSQSEYGDIVTQLANEFRQEIKDGAARSVANHVIAGFEIHDSEPVVLHGVEYEGGPVEALDEALNPYDVLVWSNADNLPEEHSGGYRDQAAGRAAEALTLDLQEAVTHAV